MVSLSTTHTHAIYFSPTSIAILAKILSDFKLSGGWVCPLV